MLFDFRCHGVGLECAADVSEVRGSFGEIAVDAVAGLNGLGEFFLSIGQEHIIKLDNRGFPFVNHLNNVFGANRVDCFTEPLLEDVCRPCPFVGRVIFVRRGEGRSNGVESRQFAGFNVVQDFCDSLFRCEQSRQVGPLAGSGISLRFKFGPQLLGVCELFAVEAVDEAIAQEFVDADFVKADAFV